MIEPLFAKYAAGPEQLFIVSNTIAVVVLFGMLCDPPDTFRSTYGPSDCGRNEPAAAAPPPHRKGRR